MSEHGSRLWVLRLVGERPRRRDCVHRISAFAPLPERDAMSGGREAHALRECVHVECGAGQGAGREGAREGSLPDGRAMGSILLRLCLRARCHRVWAHRTGGTGPGQDTSLAKTDILDDHRHIMLDPALAGGSLLDSGVYSLS